MDFIANEKKYVEKLLNTKTLTPRKVKKDLRLIAQYYLAKGMSTKETLDSLILFINEVNKNNSGEKWRDVLIGMINDIVKKDDHKLRDIENIVITKGEWEKIKQIDKEHLKRYAFGLLVYSKIINHDKESKWVDINNTSGFAKDVKVNANPENREKYFHALKNRGLITIAKKSGSTAIKIDFEEKNGEPHIIIPESNVSNFISYYEATKNKNAIVCSLCGDVEIREGIGRKPKYCSKCTKERNRLRKQKQRRKEGQQELS